MAGHLTIRGSATAELMEKKSRFIAHICHVETEDEALSCLQDVRAANRMARHNVYAYVLQSGRVRFSDDGEPQKTAGTPTLEVIQHAGLSDVIVVTTRYFGGILLGTGGLVRAYTQAAQAAVDAAQKVSVTSCVDVVAELPYELYERAVRIAQAAGAKIEDTAFTDCVLLTLRMRAGTQGPLVQKLVEITRGQVEIMETEPFDTAF